MFAVGYMILMIGILSAVWINTSVSLQSGAGAILTQSVEMGTYKIDEIMMSNEQALYTILQNNEYMQAFETDKETLNAVAAQNMLQALRKATLTSRGVENLFYYDLIGDKYIAAASSDLSYENSVAFEKSIRELNEQYPDNMPSHWFCRQIADKYYVIRLYKNKKRILGAFVNAENILKDSGNERVTLTLVDMDGNIVRTFGDDDLSEIDPELGVLTSGEFEGKAGWTPRRQFYLIGASDDNWGFRLFASMKQPEVFGSFQVLQVVIIVLVLSAILILAGISVYARKAVYKPLMDLLSAMNRIESGDQEQRLSDTADTEEFRRINSSFNQMMDTIVNLRMRSYEERIQFDEATLKYVQLQIKPHFFLNALTTIHSMSYQDKNAEIREYIERLSENVRYLFKSGMHTVPLSEEIAHVENYIAMQEILYPGCVFEFIDIDEDIEDYPIPQLIIHTILENIYKHAVSVDNLTSILISAKIGERDGEQMCHIVIEDDGEGYPDSFLKQVENGEVKVQENGHGVGLWNLKKTLELMYRRGDLIEFSNKDPHGSRTQMWIPRRVKRQSSVWKL